MKRLKALSVFLTVVSLLALSLATASPALAAGASGTQLERYIVTFNADVKDAEKESEAGAFEGAVGQRLDILGNANVMFLSPRAAEALSRKAGVSRVEEDAIVYADGQPKSPPTAQPTETLPWGVNRIDADLAWGTSTGIGIKVAVIDTGIDLSHPDLKANIKGGANIINPGRSANDDNGHGTHVAGTIAAVDNAIGVIGVAPGASLYAVKVLNRSGSGFMSDVIAGIQWAVNNPYGQMDVISMSLGSSTGSASLQAAVDAAYNAGIVVVAAAGNSGATSSPGVNYPAAYSSVIAVAATDSNDQRASWSSYGPDVEVSAPGANIYSTWTGGAYNTISGTSMATPHVAGTAALIRAAHPTWSAAQVRGALTNTADDIGTTGRDIYFGYGLVDAQQATTGIQTP